MKIKYVEDLIESAFKRARENSKYIKDLKEKNLVKIDTIYEIFISRLDRIISELEEPRNEFYKELYNIFLGFKSFKKVKERINYIKRLMTDIYKKYRNNIRLTNDIKIIEKYRKEFYGRMASILRRNNWIFNIYLEYKKVKKRMPDIKNYPTVIIAGLPNVGKSTLLKRLTGSNVKIEPYPFTTKDLMIGYIEDIYFKIQVIDTPGILDRDIEELNNIEKKAILAIKYLSDIIIYVFDVTESCGYSIEEQKNLLNRILKYFNEKNIILYFSKSDIFSEKDKDKMKKILDEYKFNYFCDPEILKNFLIEYVKSKKLYS